MRPKYIFVARLVCLLLFLGAGILLAQSPIYPTWWASQGVLNSKSPNDYAVVNQGQLKNMATGAAATFDSMGLSGSFDSMVSQWKTPTPHTDDFGAVNLGQLKAVAKPFFDSLINIGSLSGTSVSVR